MHTAVNMGNGAGRMRTADDPWGPWTPPQDVIAGGVPADGPIWAVRPRRRAAARGCTDPDAHRTATCSPTTPTSTVFFYSANIIEQWITSRRQRRGHSLERLDVGSVSGGPARTHIRKMMEADAHAFGPRVVATMNSNRHSLGRPGCSRRQPMAAADPSAGETTVLGPFTGVGAPLHPRTSRPCPSNTTERISGWSYEHDGQLHFLVRRHVRQTETGELIGGLGAIGLRRWLWHDDLEVAADPARDHAAEHSADQARAEPGTTEMSAINPGHAMESFKTPLGGFSSRRDRRFGLFYASGAAVRMRE